MFDCRWSNMNPTAPPSEFARPVPDTMPIQMAGLENSGWRLLNPIVFDMPGRQCHSTNLITMQPSASGIGLAPPLPPPPPLAPVGPVANPEAWDFGIPLGPARLPVAAPPRHEPALSRKRNAPGLAARHDKRPRIDALVSAGINVEIGDGITIGRTPPTRRRAPAVMTNPETAVPSLSRPRLPSSPPRLAAVAQDSQGSRRARLRRQAHGGWPGLLPPRTRHRPPDLAPPAPGLEGHSGIV